MSNNTHTINLKGLFDISKKVLDAVNKAESEAIAQDLTQVEAQLKKREAFEANMSAVVHETQNTPKDNEETPR